MLQARRLPHTRLGLQHDPLQIFDFQVQLAYGSQVYFLVNAALDIVVSFAQIC